LQRALLRGAALGERRYLRPRFARFGFQCVQRPIGLRDRAFGVAQRVARLAPVGLPSLQLAAQRLDARAQRGQVFFT
jgi:hypothetical protein